MLFAVFAISAVTAGTLDIQSLDVTVNDVAGSVVASPGETIDIEIVFVSNEDIEDAKVRVWISGYKDDIEASTSRFDVIADKTYKKTLALTIPDVNDIEDLDEDLSLHVEIADSNDDYELDPEYEVTVEKESYTLDLLSVEAPAKASAGDVIAIDVVLKNIGRKNLEDSFVVAKIADLGIYKKVYFGDIAPEDNYDDDDDAEDAVNQRVYLVIPSDAKSGEYELQVKAFNYDSDAEVVKSITISGVAAEDDGTAIDTAKDTTKGISNSMIVLTVALVIVFLVLLIVLIVLLTKKPAEKVEDFGETSYY